jgi:HSP20 family protein
VDLPGVSPEDLNVTIANNVLHIEGERRKIHEEDTPYSHRLERSFGRVKRSLVIPEQADADSGLANFAHGVLTVKFGKKEGAISGRKLQIT